MSREQSWTEIRLNYIVSEKRGREVEEKEQKIKNEKFRDKAIIEKKIQWIKNMNFWPIILGSVPNEYCISIYFPFHCQYEQASSWIWL